MRLVFQRVKSAAVTADGNPAGEIGQGALLLLGIGQEDTPDQAATLAKKVAGLRVFSDENGKFNYSLLDIGGEALVVPNFTLYGDCSHGKRPEFLRAARPQQAKPLFELFVKLLKDNGVKRVETGVFGASMRVQMDGHGPVTLLLDTDEL